MIFNKDCRPWERGNENNLIILKRFLYNIASFIIVHKSCFITSLKYSTDSVFLVEILFFRSIRGKLFLFSKIEMLLSVLETLVML